MNLTQMRAMLRKGLGDLNESQLPPDEADLLLNESLFQVEARYDFKEKEQRAQIAMVAGQNIYPLPGDIDAIQSVSVIHDDDGSEGESYPLIREKAEVYQESHHEDEDYRDWPEFYHRVASNLYLRPVPGEDQEGRIAMYYLRGVATLLMTGTYEIPQLPRDWHFIVVEGAIAMGHELRREHDLAVKTLNLQNMRIRTAVPVQAKEERDQRRGAVQIHEHYTQHRRSGNGKGNWDRF